MSSYFWFIAGTLTGLSAMLIAFPLLRAARGALDKRSLRIAATAIGIAGFAAAALFLYRILGRPDLLDGHVAAAAAAHPGMSASNTGAAPASMESAAARLEARLASGGGSREDWLLLAQSYDFMGRAADAQRARERADGGSSPVSQAKPPAASSAVLPASESAAQFERRVHASPDDVEAWRALAELYRRQRDSSKARNAFANLVRLKAMDADAWADYADVLASTSGSLQQSAQAIDSALRLDPAHPKALWLKASLAHEQRRYADALVVWKQLRTALPPNSPDLPVIDANIAEASELAGTTAAASTPAGGVEVSGTISIDSKLATRIPAAATLFIYAKAVDSPGPPLAVIRQSAGGWPVTFRLDDTLAMIPSRKLSQFERVIVEARISRSGQAIPAPGDLYVTSAVLKPHERKKLALVIDREVG
jgi:cytochrome c-type biogenesis protein CcmH/NrfG